MMLPQRACVFISSHARGKVSLGVSERLFLPTKYNFQHWYKLITMRQPVFNNCLYLPKKRIMTDSRF